MDCDAAPVITVPFNNGNLGLKLANLYQDGPAQTEPRGSVLVLERAWLWRSRVLIFCGGVVGSGCGRELVESMKVEE